jgi:hypothetical protein
MDEVPEISEETKRFLENLYNGKELAALLAAIGVLDGWIIIPFNDPPVINFDDFPIKGNCRLN